MARRLTVRLATLVALGSSFAVVCSCNSVAGLGPAGCEVDVEDVEPIHYAEGTALGGVYMSSPWDGELLAFRGGAVLVLEHHLGVAPRSIQAWVALPSSGGSSGAQGDGVGGASNVGPLVPAAGNQAELLDVSEESITLQNATCSDYWLLVTADAGDG